MGAKSLTEGKLPGQEAHKQSGTATKAQVSGADGEAFPDPGDSQSQQKEPVRQPGKPWAQRTEEIIPQSQKKPQPQSGQQPLGGNDGGRHANRRCTQLRAARGSS